MKVISLAYLSQLFYVLFLRSKLPSNKQRVNFFFYSLVLFNLTLILVRLIMFIPLRLLMFMNFSQFLHKLNYVLHM